MRSVARAVVPCLLAVAGAAQTAAPDHIALATACNRFAIDLHLRLAASGNPTASPASVAVVLLMLLPGARGDTATELAALLHLPSELRSDRLHTATKALLAALVPDASVEDGATLRLVLDLWTARDAAIVPDYAALLRSHYGAAQHTLDFRGDVDAARVTINQHIAKQTNERIQDLLAADVLTPDTAAVLTTAIWLRAKWQDPFDRDSTVPGTFTLADRTPIEVPMMHQETSLEYAATDGWQCLVMPLVGTRIVAEIVLPRPGKDLLAAERAVLEGAHDARRQPTLVTVSLPRFRVMTTHRLREPIGALGGGRVFDRARADFRGIEPNGACVFDDVVQRTWIEANEHGIEAAAAAVVATCVGTSPARPVAFVVDRPFACIVRDRGTGLVLFVGRIDNPRPDRPVVRKVF